MSDSLTNPQNNPYIRKERSMQSQSSTNNYVDFYKHLKVPPTSSMYKEEQEYENSRKFLYSQLGFIYEAIAHKRIIEFGPGLGQNLELIAKHSPSSIAFADHLPSVITNIPDKLRRSNASNIDHIESYSIDLNCSDDEWDSKFSEKRFDVVIAEGVVNGNPNPGRIWTRLSGLVAKGGVLIGTGVHPCGAIDQALRRLWYVWYVEHYGDSEQAIAALINDYGDGLSKLGTRKLARDWVLDNIVNPLVGRNLQKDFFFSASDLALLLASLEKESGISFVPLGCSPRIVCDTTWFKHFQSRFSSHYVLSEFADEFEKGALIFLNADDRYLPTFSVDSKVLSANVVSLFEIQSMSLESSLSTKQSAAKLRTKFAETLSVIQQILTESPVMVSLLSDFMGAIAEYDRSGVPPAVPLSLRQFHSRGLHYFSFYRLD